MWSSFRSALCTVGAGLLGVPAFAANWEFEPRFEVQALHDDNYRLTDDADAEIEVTGGLLDAELAFRSRGPRSLIEVLPRVRTTVFPDAQEEESTDGFLGIGWERRDQRLESSVEARYADESVVTSELLVADFPDLDLGDVVVGDSGRVSIRNRRKLLSVRPALSYAWTQRHRVEAGLSYIEASFDQDLIEQRGFTDLLARAGIAVEVSPRDTLRGRVQAGVYDADFAFDETQRAGIEGEWSRLWSQTARFYARLGAESTGRDVRALDPQRNPITVSVSDTAIVGGIGAAWTYEVTQILLDAVRSVSPSSAGVVVERNELRFGMRRDVRARLAVFANLRGVRTQGAVERIADVRDRDYLTGRIGFEWRMSRPLRVLGAYDYAWQEFEAEQLELIPGEPSDATSNAVSLSFIYEPRRRD
jgi:hypothetical protein